VSWSWDRCLAAIRRLSGATHGPLTVGSCTITPVTGQPYGIRDDAPATVTRLFVTTPGWCGWRDSWREAYTLARSLDRRHRYTEALQGPWRSW